MTSEEPISKIRPVTVDYLEKKHISPEDTNKLHYHPYNEFIILNKGLVIYATDKGVIKLKEKGIVYMPAHTLHNPFVQSSHPYERYRIRFSTDFANGIITQAHLLDSSLKAPYIKQLNKNDFDEIYLLTQSLYKIYSKGKNEDFGRLNECVHIAMLSDKGKNAQAIPHTPNSSYITDVLDYIKSNYREQITIQTLADNFFVSKSKLIYDFSSYCRISICEYVTMTRIEAAKALLLKGMSVTAASEACGFSTPTYFIKVFSRITDLTPLKFQIKYSRKTNEQ